jgi:hypothetical protein
MMKEEPPRHALARSLTSSPQCLKTHGSCGMQILLSGLAVYHLCTNIIGNALDLSARELCPETQKMTRHCHGNSHAQHDARRQIQIVHTLHHYQDLKRSM